MRNIVYDKQITKIRQDFRNDGDALRVIDEFDSFMEYAALCYSEGGSRSDGDEAVFAAVRAVIVGCRKDKRLDRVNTILVWVANCCYPYVGVKLFAQHLIAELFNAPVTPRVPMVVRRVSLKPERFAKD
jgi:hypothetical protein